MSEPYSENIAYLAVCPEYSNWAGFKITFLEPLQTELLQNVVRRSFTRFPYMGEKVVLDGERYVLVQNEKPFVIYTDQGPMDILGPNNNNYQFRMTVWDNILDARFFHGLCDARSFNRYMKSVLCEYFTILKGHMHDVPGAVPFDSKIPEAEIMDPFLNVDRQSSARSAQSTNQGSKGDACVHEEAAKRIPNVRSVRNFKETTTLWKKAKDGSRKDIFRVPIAADSDGKTYSYQIRMDEQQFMKYSKSVDGSPNVVVALLMAHAILSEHPEASDEIVASVAMDLKTALKRPESYMSEIALLPLRYQKRIEMMPLATQATCFRGMIFANSDPDQVRSSFPGMTAFYDLLAGIPKFSDRKELAYKTAVDSAFAYTFIVSYAGQSFMGDLEQYIESLYTIVEIYGNDLKIEINCLKNEFFINIIQGFKSDRYVKAMIRQIEQEGMSCNPDQIVTLVPMGNDIAGS